MEKGRLLIVEDDYDVANMLRIYFNSLGYEVEVTHKGLEALKLTHRKTPNLIILDINLPDLNGYEVCRRLRGNLRTSHIPIIFLTQRDERSDRIAGLELGADDYITKPFDIEELRLRVQNALRRVAYENLSNPVTGLPSSKLIEEQLKKLLTSENWALLYIGINHFHEFTDVYGFVAGDDVLRFTGFMLGEVVDSLGSPGDFIGHVGAGDFIIITAREKAVPIEEEAQARFAARVETFYSFRDRERGYIVIEKGGRVQRVPFMELVCGIITAADGPFADIREITEAAAERRRKAAG